MTATPDHEQLAREYLRSQLGDDAPEVLVGVGRFGDALLEGEGDVSVFTFTLTRGGNPPEPCCVVAGQTEPNYYPVWDLTPREVYLLHIGTRFMLTLGIQQADPTQLSGTLEEQLLRELARVVPGEPVNDTLLLAAFSLEDQTHAVWRLKVAGEDVYVIAGDLPLGISRNTGLPPHAAYRLHLGRVIEQEARLDNKNGR